GPACQCDCRIHSRRLGEKGLAIQRRHYPVAGAQELRSSDRAQAFVTIELPCTEPVEKEKTAERQEDKRCEPGAFIQMPGKSNWQGSVRRSIPRNAGSAGDCGHPKPPCFRARFNCQIPFARAGLVAALFRAVQAAET